MKRYLITIPVIALIPKVTLAHCPLCVVGAGSLAVLAASLGVSSVIVGVLIGAFALALGIWTSGLIKRRYVPYQKLIIVLVVSLSTVIPIMPMVRHYKPLYIPFMGQYGTTYTINLYLLGVIIGAVIMFVSPFLSKRLTKLRNKRVAFQGIIMTIILLIITSIIIQLLS